MRAENGRPVLTPLLLGAALALLSATSNAAPPVAILPNPPHLSSNAPAKIQLAWSQGDYELIVNGDFETGNLNGWTKNNIGGVPPVANDTYINNGNYVPQSRDGPYPPFGGNYSSIGDGNGAGSMTLSQVITIPAEAESVTLSWVDQIRNFFNTFVATQPLQEFRVEVRSNATVLATVYRTEPGDPTLNNWVKRSAALTGFRGQRVTLAFSFDQNWNFFNLYLDNISVRVSSRAAIAYDVYWGTDSNLGTSNLLGTTTNTTWDLPPLQPERTYFWRLVSRQGTNEAPGPVWRFTTAAAGPVDHFVRWTPARTSLPTSTERWP